MRDNEPLGLYAELRDRADRYGELGVRLRKRLLDPPPANGATAQSINPFMRKLRNRILVAGKPNAEWGRQGRAQRTIWPEAQLGIALDTVIKAVIDESEITAGQMLSDWRGRRFTRPRQVTMYMIDRYCPQYSLPQIGFIFSRDHTTVLHSIEAVSTRLKDCCPETTALVTSAHQRLRELADNGK